MTAKQKPATLKTLRDVEKSLAGLVQLTLRRNFFINELEGKIADMREQYGEELADLSSDIKAEEKYILEYLAAHKADFDGPPRSVELPAGTIGYRLGQPRLKPLAKWTWDKILETLQADKAECYLRVKTEVDREALLADAEAQGADVLKGWGLKTVQDDKPFIDLKLDLEKERENYGEAF